MANSAGEPRKRSSGMLVGGSCGKETCVGQTGQGLGRCDEGQNDGD